MPNDKSRRTRPDRAENLPRLTDEEIEDLESQNVLEQFDRVIEIITDATENTNVSTSFQLRSSLLCELQQIAVKGLEPCPGTFRTNAVSIEGSSHVPPPADEVTRLVEDLCDYVNDNWLSANPIHLSAYAMWRINWIHPFTNGNGRTSRAIAYLILCMKVGYRIPGSPTVPDQIVQNKESYYHALEAADAAYHEDRIDTSDMESLFSDYLTKQLS